MNLDELVLRNVMSVEEADQLVHNPYSSSSPAAATASLFLGKRDDDVLDPVAEVSASAEGMDWMHYQRALLIDSKLPVSQAVYNHGSVPDMGVYNMQTMSMTTSASSNSDFHEGNSSGRKRRQLDDIKEKTIERRQRRMIKNRESAARSRARKQAYTNQLEHEVLCLRKTNSWLRKQEEVERLFSSNPIPMPRYQLRRTSSAFF